MSVRPVPPRHGRAASAGRVGRLVANEPVRLYVYTVLAIVVGLLVARGVLSTAEAPLWTALVATLLGVPAVETARSKVSPVWTDTDRRGDGDRRRAR
jgi:hypothetical protein